MRNPIVAKRHQIEQERLRRRKPRAHSPRWSDGDDERLTAMFEAGASVIEVADALGRTVPSVRGRRYRIGA